MTLPGAPPLPLPGGPPPPPRGAPTGAITSDHQGGLLDHIRTAIMSLQHFAEQATDDQDIHTVTKCIVGLQSILADHAKGADAAMGTTPALKHVRQRTQGY
jgi:hypothetical protein